MEGSNIVREIGPQYGDPLVRGGQRGQGTHPRVLEVLYHGDYLKWKGREVDNLFYRHRRWYLLFPHIVTHDQPSCCLKWACPCIDSGRVHAVRVGVVTHADLSAFIVSNMWEGTVQ